MPRVRPGFTLIELLVVIVIIVLLIAIALPVMGRGRDAAGATVCGSNLRQIASGLHLYAEDQDGWVPYYYNGTAPADIAATGELTGNVNWNERLTGVGRSPVYLPFNSARPHETAWFCPLTTRQLLPRGGDTSTQYGINFAAYGWREANGAWQFGRRPVKLERLRPSTFLLADAAFGHTPPRGYQDYFNEHCGTTGGHNEPWPFDPVTQKAVAHHGAANVALTDTSIERINRWDPAVVTRRVKGVF